MGTVAMNAQTLEDEKVASAVKTDFILSAEIMAITLAAVANASFWMQALVLASSESASRSRFMAWSR